MKLNFSTADGCVQGRVIVLSACAALAVPSLLAFNLPPSSTFLNQAAALIGWGAWFVFLLGSSERVRGPASHPLMAFQAALAILLLAALASPLWTGLPWSLALSAVGMIGAAALAAQVGAAMQRGGLAPVAFRAFCIGLVVAAFASSVVGLLQVFVPQWTDGSWIASTYLPGRAVGNMRQPNHLSSLLIWGIVAAVWVGETGVLKRWLSHAAALLFVFVVVLSGSRTGALSVLLLALWGLLDRRLSRSARTLLLIAPLAGLLSWYGLAVWADQTHHLFGGESRFSGKGDISSSRYGIWANTLTLIGMHPWAGVGYGELNFAWTLTPFPGRPVAFFDHTHNLLLQFAVELGLPLAALVIGLLGWALVGAARTALRARDDPDPRQAPLRRAALVMVLMILLHSLLEYPLWYAYFLLPAAFALGLGLAGPAGASSAASALPMTPPSGRAQATRPLLLAAMLLMAGGLLSVADYFRVVVIFAPRDRPSPLAERIVDGQRSVFFSHHADYAAATTAERPGDAIDAFAGATHNLLDARLMEAWAKALEQTGDTERARYVAQRLKEFRNPQSEEFFAPCAEAQPGASPADAAPGAGSTAAAALPFQCSPPTRTFRYEDFEARRAPR